MESKTAIKVEVSARHCHLCETTIKALFGPTFDLNQHVRHYLSQKNQYVSDIRLTILAADNEGNEHRIEGVSILGPARTADQVEISLTDAYQLGVNPPLTVSGALKEAAPVTLIAADSTGNELARVNLPHALIIAKRHLHCNPRQAQDLQIINGETVKIAVESPWGRHTIYDEVIVRIDPTFDLAVHLDTDEGNAAGLKGTGLGHLMR